VYTEQPTPLDQTHLIKSNSSYYINLPLSKLTALMHPVNQQTVVCRTDSCSQAARNSTSHGYLPNFVPKFTPRSTPPLLLWTSPCLHPPSSKVDSSVMPQRRADSRRTSSASTLLLHTSLGLAPWSRRCRKGHSPRPRVRTGPGLRRSSPSDAFPSSPLLNAATEPQHGRTWPSHPYSSEIVVQFDGCCRTAMWPDKSTVSLRFPFLFG
jgi:hypothetical protein